MIYRRLGPGDKEYLEQVVKEHEGRGISLPHPNSVIIQAAILDNKLQGFILVQPQLHCEPLVLYNPAAYRGLMSSMEVEVRKSVTQGALYLTAEGRISKMAEIVGFEAVPETLYRKIL